ncbi:putative polyphosphate glucokinase [Hyaloraphidium curvatum]|nr:putative polyphosphate glucokinase [Hyaloraphidium curvatum]
MPSNPDSPASASPPAPFTVPEGAKVVFGIDIGGSGIKGAPVDVEKGKMLTERFRIETPQPATPEAVGETVKKLVEHFGWTGPIGCTFPAIVHKGHTLSAANVDGSWLNAHAEKILSEAVGRPVVLINDADAAGLAEAVFGAAKGVPGTVCVLTFGTGIGSALVVDGKLILNTEFGHLIFPKHEIAERYCAARVKEDTDMKWDEYSKRVNEYLTHVQLLLSPSLFVAGGGISKKADKWLPKAKEGLRCDVVPAALQNEAGIIGAALQAARLAGIVDVKV